MVIYKGVGCLCTNAQGFRNLGDCQYVGVLFEQGLLYLRFAEYLIGVKSGGILQK